MVDCGSNSNEAINFLNENKIDSLIIDHHQINKPYPKDTSIINPKKGKNYVEYDYFCATSLTLNGGLIIFKASIIFFCP